MTRVAQIMAGAPSGGAELFFERLTSALHRAGETVLPIIRRDPARAGRLRDQGLDPQQLRFGGPLDLFTTPRLTNLLRRFEPRLAIAWMNRAARATPAGPWVKVGRLGGYYDLRYYRGCDHLVGNTKGIVAYIREQGWPPARVHYLPNFAPDLAGATAAAMPGRPTILALGRLHKNKGFDVLIEAAARLPDIHILIAGEGPERVTLEALARSLGIGHRIHMPGWRTDQAALLAGCDMLVCPSRHEPLGNVVIEAFAAGRPVIAAAVAGPLELIDPERTGLLVPPENPAALAAAIGRLLHDPALAASLAQAGRAEWHTHYAEAPVIQRWRTAIAEMAA